jgi:NAD(P)-dependent dehydrogenase (short-subunit alcohol dehydrogenase family)
MSKLAVVTGGAGGMGLAVAHVIGRDSAVLICDVSQERLDAAKRELGGAGIDCAATICDITDRQSVGQLVEHAQQLGTVTSVVHTAGVSPSMGSADMILRINAVGTVLVNRAFYEIASEGMALVNVASVAGHQLPGNGLTVGPGLVSISEMTKVTVQPAATPSVTAAATFNPP